MVSDAPARPRGRRIRRSHVPFEVEEPELPGLVYIYLKERFARASQLAVSADWRVWKAWCERQEPKRGAATASDLRAFIADCSPLVEVDSRGTAAVKLDMPAEPNVKVATTLTQYLNSIGVVHRLAGLPDSTKDPLVTSARRMFTRGRMASAQKAPLGPALIIRICETLSEPTLWNLRARALLLVAHSTMARRGKLVGLEVADQDGQGSDRYLSAIAASTAREWLDAVNVNTGHVFRRIRTYSRVADQPISAHEVARIFKVAYVKFLAALPEEERSHLHQSGVRISAHSTRIGAAQDLVAKGADSLAVMQAGGWKDLSMPALYTRRLNALRGGMAQCYRNLPSEALTARSSTLPLSGPD